MCARFFFFGSSSVGGGRFFVFVKPLTLPPPGVEEEAERERRRDVERERTGLSALLVKLVSRLSFSGELKEGGWTDGTGRSGGGGGGRCFHLGWRRQGEGTSLIWRNVSLLLLFHLTIDSA